MVNKKREIELEKYSKEYGIGYSFIVAAAIVVVLAAIKSASVIVVPFLLALFLSIILSPLFLWIRSKHVPTSLSLVIVLLLLTLLFIALGLVIGSSVNEFSANLPAYEIKLKNDFHALFDRLGTLGITLPKEQLSELFNTDSVMNYIAKTLKSLGSILTNSFMIILTVVFMLLEVSRFREKISSSHSKNFDSLQHIVDTIQRFVVLKSATSAATGIIVAIALTLLGVDYAVLWGILAFLLNFVPNIGSIIAAVPAVLMALVQFDIQTALIVAAIYLGVNITIGSILEPKIMGDGLGLSTLVVFLSLIFWGWLLGPVGMLLSIPLTIMVKIVLGSKQQTKWMASLLGN